MPTDYQKTKIYKIESHLGDKIYIGSTAKAYLSQRFQQHKSTYKLWKAKKIGKITSFELFDEYGPENCQIVLIEEYPCSSKDTKNARESHYIRTMECVNKVIPNRTYKEHYEDNREYILERTKKYQELNKEKITEQRKKHYESNKEEISIKRKAKYQQNKLKEQIKPNQ